MTALALAVASGATAQSDFDKYVESVRKAGMTERAEGDLRGVAAILAGSSTLTATQTPDGHIARSYRSASCFVPTKDEALLAKQRVLRQEMQAKADVWMRFLLKHADKDDSGFVSTEEGNDLRRVVEMGVVAGQLNFASADEVSKGLFEDDNKAAADIAAYQRILVEAKKEGLVGLPELPVGLAERRAEVGSRPISR